MRYGAGMCKVTRCKNHEQVENSRTGQMALQTWESTSRVQVSKLPSWATPAAVLSLKHENQQISKTEGFKYMRHGTDILKLGLLR